MEQYHIHESDLVLEGKTWSAGFFAKMPHPDGRPYGTFRAYTLLVDGDRLEFRNSSRFPSTSRVYARNVP